MRIERQKKATAGVLIARPSEDEKLQARIEQCEAVMRILGSFEHDDWSHRVVMRLVERVCERERMRLRKIQLGVETVEIPKPIAPITKNGGLFLRDDDVDAFFDALFQPLQEVE
jgi:hypothetical protein